MKEQWKILKSTLFKNWIWIALFFFIISIQILFLILRPPEMVTTENDFLALIGYPNINNYSMVERLIAIYQTGLLFYLLYQFYKNELLYAKENIVLRYPPKKWIRDKLCTSLLFIIIGKTIQIFLTYLYFIDKIPFHWNYMINPIILIMAIPILIITSLNIPQKIYANIFLIFIFLMMLNTFQPIIILPIAIILMIYNWKTFTFKKVI